MVTEFEKMCTWVFLPFTSESSSRVVVGQDTLVILRQQKAKLFHASLQCLANFLDFE